MQQIIATGKSNLCSNKFHKALQNTSNNKKHSTEWLQLGVADASKFYIVCTITTYAPNLKQCITQFWVVYIDQYFENNFYPFEEAHRIGNDLNSKNI